MNRDQWIKDWEFKNSWRWDGTLEQSIDLSRLMRAIYSAGACETWRRLEVAWSDLDDD